MALPAQAKRPGVEAKVQAGTLAATIAGAIVYILQQYVFKGDVNPGLVSLVYAAVPGALALVAGYYAPHTPRPAAAATVVPPSGTVTVVPAQPPEATS